MRLIFALFYIGLGIFLYLKMGGDNLHPYVGVAVGFGLLFSSVIVCNEGFIRRLKGQSDSDYIKELIEKQLADVESYTITRGATFEDLGTGCLCHILEVGTNELLCLYGQYLYDYAEITDDPEMNQQRKFPTNEFSLVRKIKNSEILHLEISGVPINETCCRKVDINSLHELGVQLKNGELINGVSFDDIKAMCG